MNAIEQVQIRATKAVDGFNQLTYEERLRKLDLPTLAHRRKRGDMIEVFKHATVYDKSSLPSSMRFRNRPSRKHNFPIVRTEAADGILGQQRNSFYFRTASTWKKLPRTVAESTTVDAFKQNIDTFWVNDPTRLSFDSKPYHHPNE